MFTNLATLDLASTLEEIFRSVQDNKMHPYLPLDYFWTEDILVILDRDAIRTENHITKDTQECGWVGDIYVLSLVT